MSFELSGKIVMIADEQRVSESFRKREFAIETNEQYFQSILIECQQDKCDLLNALKLDDEVKVSTNIKGRKWTNPQGETKYFNTITAWKIEKTGVSQSAPPNKSAVDAYNEKHAKKDPEENKAFIDDEEPFPN